MYAGRHALCEHESLVLWFVETCWGSPSIAGAGRPTDVGDLLWQRKSYRGAVLCEGHSADGHDMRPKVWVTRAPSE